MPAITAVERLSSFASGKVKRLLRSTREVTFALPASLRKISRSPSRWPKLSRFSTFAGRFPILAVSGEAGTNMDTLRKEMFQLLNVIRVYTKVPGRRADRSTPFVLKRGATVQDAAGAVHKDFAERLKYARIWGSRAFEGQMVQREHVLEDGDILELHA